MDLKGTRTEQNLIDAFANEAQCSAIYDYAGRRASVEGHNDISAKLETSAKIRQNQARGNLQILQKNPLTGLSNTVTRLNLQSLISTATKNYHDKYSKMAEVAVMKVLTGLQTGSILWQKQNAWKPNCMKTL